MGKRERIKLVWYLTILSIGWLAFLFIAVNIIGEYELGKARKWKAIRKTVREDSNAPTIAPEYQDTNVRVRSFTGSHVKALEDGVETVKPLITSTLVLNKDSERGFTKEIKKQFKKNPHLMGSRFK